MDAPEGIDSTKSPEYERMDAGQYLEMSIAERRAKAELWEGDNIFTQFADSKDLDIRHQMRDSYLKEAEALEGLDPLTVTKEEVLVTCNQFHEVREALTRKAFGEGF